MTDILFAYDHILIRSEYRTPDLHKHLAAHMVFGIKGELTCVVGEDTFQCRGAFISSDVEHTIYAETGDMLLFLLDTTSEMARAVEESFLRGRDFSLIDTATVDLMADIWEKCAGDLKEVDRRMPEACGIEKGIKPAADERIQRVLSFLESRDTIPSDIMEQLCGEACLSESRLSHLFKEQMGIALGRYLVLEKMKKGYLHYCSTKNITEAALNAGFDSPSHFAATCKRMFGISFSEFIKS
ncbi:MAG: helix-turn-helix transcriptional regulator [Lachnospiraceae bacterium]|nr:helix-turn-helix transcriptional regulator [Lachnospiraceae bacterium]